MQTELKIIFSMYDRVTENTCGKVSDCRFAMCLDETELLLLLERVFEQKKYKVISGDERPYITILQSEETALSCLLCSQCDLTPVHGRRPFAHDKLVYNKDDYKLICREKDSWPSEVRRNLLYANFLVEVINMRVEYNQRDAELYFAVFDMGKGKSLINNMFLEILLIVDAYRKTGQAGVERTRRQIDQWFGAILDLYDERFYIAEQMKIREEEAQITFDEAVFSAEINQFLNEINRIEDSVSQNMMDFVFSKSQAHYAYAYYLLGYMQRLCSILLGKEVEFVLGTDKSKESKAQLFCKMGQSIDTLQEQLLQGGFEKWCTEFYRGFYEVWKNIDNDMVRMVAS